MRTAMRQLNLSARPYHRILKLARTIADLAGSEEIQSAHLAEALQYRSKLIHGTMWWGNRVLKANSLSILCILLGMLFH